MEEMGRLSSSLAARWSSGLSRGPARAAGSAGTGKTIVAIHRAVRLARDNADARVLLASFSEPLAAELAKKVLVLAPETGGVVPRITTASFQGIAEQMFQLEHGVRPRIASEAELRERLRAAATSAGLKGLGRKSRLGPNQRAKLWPGFQPIRDALAAERYTTWASVSLAWRMPSRGDRPSPSPMLWLTKPKAWRRRS